MIRVMLVDDDKLARMGLETMLPWKKHGMEVVASAANGAKALEELSRQAIDLVFVDLSMPVMSGLELIEVARARYPRLQYVVLTFHEDFGFVQKALRLGVLDYISKLELENADYDRLCESIAGRMAARAMASNGTWVEETKALPDWSGMLEGLRWVYDREWLQALCAEIARSTISMTQLERMLVRAVINVEDQMGFAGPPVPRLRAAADAAKYLPCFRQALLDHARDSDRREGVPVCMLRAIERVERAPGADLHSDAMAAYVNLSRPYFSSSFSREVGMPYNSYVRRERVCAAARLLTTTRLSIGDIAAQLGYDDVRSFIKLFADHVGQTPLAYRQGMTQKRPK